MTAVLPVAAGSLHTVHIELAGVETDDRGLPNTEVLVWPAPDRPGKFHPNIREFIEIDWPPHQWEFLAEQAVAAGVAPMVLDVADDSRTSAVLRPAGGLDWRVDLDLDAEGYRARLDALGREGCWPAGTTSRLERDSVRYGVIWYREPDVAAYRSRSTTPGWPLSPPTGTNRFTSACSRPATDPRSARVSGVATVATARRRG